MTNPRERIRELVARYGRAVQYVFPEADGVAFAYTVGNALAGLPELLVVGNLRADDAMLILNLLSDEMKRRRAPFGDRELFRLGDAATELCIVKADDRAKALTLFATGHHGHARYDVMQVVVPDPRGRFPWNGCEGRYAVEVLSAPLN